MTFDLEPISEDRGPPAFVADNSWGSASTEQKHRISNVFKNKKAEKNTSVIELGVKKMKKSFSDWTGRERDELIAEGVELGQNNQNLVTKQLEAL